MKIVEQYLQEMRSIHYNDVGTDELTYYHPLLNLLNAVGRTLKPKVRARGSLTDAGVGHPDIGLFSDAQAAGQLPERGVIEVKGTAADVAQVAQGEQVARYLTVYRQVLVTNYWDFVLVGCENDRPVTLESYRLAENEADFWRKAAHPRKLARDQGEPFLEYLKRVMLQPTVLSRPRDVAWFLASYARDALARLTDGTLPGLAAIRAAMEEALGLTFEGERGDRFFRSTLIQTLFYGVFSAWVLWYKENPARTDRFDWRVSAFLLHVPVIQVLFEQLSAPSRLQAMGLVEVLNWVGDTLNRVDRAEFFEHFTEGEAVQYFYEPFLEAFSPVLRKELGVWYTPPEVVTYMVERVDAVLREELGIADGLADENVVVLDPCCGTGAYLIAVLQKIATTCEAKGMDALSGAYVRKAATERVFGFEILPAPFVIAHLQLGLLLQNLNAPLSARQRAGVYLTNALTGWRLPEEPKQMVMLPELAEERDAAERVKQKTPVLVVLGNPPYNSFAGVAVAEERELTDAYRKTKRAPRPQGQGLNDLYVRFLRMAERCIVEMEPHKGIVSFISNYSWLDGLSFTGMRERYLEVFDHVWIDCLNGDKYRTGKLTPDGKPDPSIFSTEWNREGIQVGTTIALLVHRQASTDESIVRFRHLWGTTKRQQLLETAQQDGKSLYQRLNPPLELGLPFMPVRADADYLSWPSLPDLFPLSFVGVKTSRDADLVDIERDKLEQRMRVYFDAALSDEDVQHATVSLMSSSSRRYDVVATRQHLLQRGLESGYFVRYEYRPFDARYVYWHPETKLLDEKREDLFATFQTGDVFLTSRKKAERTREGTPFYVTRNLPDWHLTRPGSVCFPLTAKQQGLFSELDQTGMQAQANLSQVARQYLATLGIPDPDTSLETKDLIWMHALAIGYTQYYLDENADGLSLDWPRIPLPDTKDLLIASASLGRQVAALLNPEQDVPGVTAGTVRPELAAIGVVAREGGGQLNPAAGDLALTAGWGYAGQRGITMPGQGRMVEREYTAAERRAIEVGAWALGLSLDQALDLLGHTTCDVYLNDVAYWRNVPANVWDYTIGGYQVIKKWLSYREQALLGRDLKLEEVMEVTNIARRITAIIVLRPELDANYQAVKSSVYDWPQKP